MFQVNLAQRLICPARGERDIALRPFAPLESRRRLPAISTWAISRSPAHRPERFLRVQNGEVETRPIKGTRPRTGDPAADAAAQAELLESEKDRAENVMIVDLLRNDLSRVCTAESVSVGQLCRLEAYRHVFHLVSSVVGRLRPSVRPSICFAPLFRVVRSPAPKVRAMEIIAELEPDARGDYCGSLGYLGFDGSADLNILIRTITAGRGWWQFPVGGGIVAQSTPCWEYDETWHKAEGLIRAVWGKSPQRRRDAEEKIGSGVVTRSGTMSVAFRSAKSSATFAERKATLTFFRGAKGDIFTPMILLIHNYE